MLSPLQNSNDPNEIGGMELSPPGMSGNSVPGSTSATGHSVREDVKQILKIALPNIAALGLTFINELANTIFVGQTGTEEELAAVGLGNMVQNCVGLSVGFGICAALDTFVSQAHGAGQPELCVDYFQRCRVLVTIQLIWMAPILWFTEDLLLLIGQDKDVAFHAGTYNKTTLFGLFFVFQFEAIRKFLGNQGRTDVAAIVAAVCSVVHLAWCTIFIYHFRLGNEGAGIANCLTWTLQMVIASGYLWYTAPKLKLSRWAVLGIQPRAFQGLRKYMEVAVPAVFALCSEWWFWEICALMAGYLGPAALAAHVSTMNVTVICFMIPLGVSQSAATLVGNSLGANAPIQAKRFTFLHVVFSIALWCVCAFFLCFGGKYVAAAYSSQADVRDLMVGLLRIFALAGLFDSTQNVMGGALRGMGKNYILAVLYTVAYYVIMLPMAGALAFPLRMGVYGVWWSMVIGTSIVATVFGIWLKTADWKALASEASERLLENCS